MAQKRDANGRFVKGNSGGPGRPPKAREERYLQILQSTLTFTDWADIVKKAGEQAKRGDKDARKWLTDYLVGPALQKHAIAHVEWDKLVIGWGDGDDSDDSES